MMKMLRNIERGKRSRVMVSKYCAKERARDSQGVKK